MNAGFNARRLKFVGIHDNLIHGAYYTIKQYSDLTGKNLKTLQSRLKRYTEVDNKLLAPRSDIHWARLESKADVISSLWLRKKW